MKQILILTFLLLSTFSFSQVMDDNNLWTKGDVYVGANSELTGVSWTDFSLTPSIGYAISDNDLIYANFFYVDNPKRSAYKLGYNRRVCSQGYVGISGALSDFYGGDAAKYLFLEAGIGRNLCDWLLVTPKISFGHLWDNNITQYSLNTTVTFSIRI